MLSNFSKVISIPPLKPLPKICPHQVVELIIQMKTRITKLWDTKILKNPIPNTDFAMTIGKRKIKIKTRSRLRRSMLSKVMTQKLVNSSCKSQMVKLWQKNIKVPRNKMIPQIMSQKTKVILSLTTIMLVKSFMKYKPAHLEPILWILMKSKRMPKSIIAWMHLSNRQ